MIEELYRTLIMNKINPTPDTLRMYMSGQKKLSELKQEYPLQYDKISESTVHNSHTPFRSLNLEHYTDVPDNVKEAYKRLKEKYDFKWGGEPFYQDAVHDDKDDVKLVQSFLMSQHTPYNYAPDKDYYGVKAYEEGYSGELLPFFMDVKNPDTDIHQMNERIEHDGHGKRGGFSVNGIARAFGQDEAPQNHINRLLYNIDDPRLKKELLEKELYSFIKEGPADTIMTITKSKGSDILPTSSTELITNGLDPMRDSEQEAVVKGLTPIEEVPIDMGVISSRAIKNAADDLGMSVHDFVHSKHVIPFLKENGFALDDIKDLDDLEKMDDDQFLYNSRSKTRKVMDRLMSRGYDNIISDEHLKVKERFL